MQNHLTTIVLIIVVAGFTIALWRMRIAYKQQKEVDDAEAATRSSRPRRED